VAISLRYEYGLEDDEAAEAVDEFEDEVLDQDEDDEDDLERDSHSRR